MGLSYAIPLIGFGRHPCGGVGSTEMARWDNSLKYSYQYGPVHAAFMYAEGERSFSMATLAGNVGITYKGFSVDATYTKENGAVNATNGDNLAVNSMSTISVLHDEQRSLFGHG